MVYRYEHYDGTTEPSQREDSDSINSGGDWCTVEG